MKISYTFITGERTEVEVAEEVGTVIVDSRRAERANNERHRYHQAYSIDGMEYEGWEFTADGNPENGILRGELREGLRSALEQLTIVQQRRFLLYASGIPTAEIARREGASFNSVQESIRGHRKSCVKF